MAGEGAWNKGTEYKYEFNTRTLAAIPDLADQYTGIITRGYVTIRPKNQNTLVGNILKAEYATINDVLPRGYKTEFTGNQLQFEQLPMQRSQPFEIFLKKGGAIKHLAVDKSVTNDEANQIKAIASIFQIDVNGDNKKHSSQNIMPENDQISGAYVAMEPSVTGHCETVYSISQLPRYIVQSRPSWAPMPNMNQQNPQQENLIQVYKTMNYTNCAVRVGYHFGVNGMTGAKPNSNHMGDAVSVSIAYIEFCLWSAQLTYFILFAAR